MISGLTAIEQDSSSTPVVGNDDVDVAVVVEIAERGASADVRLGERRSGRRRALFESAGTVVVEQLIAHAERPRLSPQ